MSVDDKLNAYKDFQHTPLKLRACLSDNSAMAAFERDYAIFDGFSDVVAVIYENIVSNKLVTDTAVYPFMFCCHHSLEVVLKYLIRHCCVLMSKRTKMNYIDIELQHRKTLRQHNLKALMVDLILMLDLDRRLTEYIELFKNNESLWEEFYEDEKGDAYRYTFSIEHKEHLSDKRLLALDVIYNKYDELTRMLSNLKYLLDSILDEYRVNTCTPNLSRYDIENISKELPDKKDWVLDSFDNVRDAICKKYSISKKELSKAIDIIKQHREFCANIGLELPFLKFEKETLKETAYIIKIFEKQQHLQDDGKAYGDIFETPTHQFVNMEEIYKISDVIPLKDLQLLFVFIEIANFGYYSEDLQEVYDYIATFERDDYLINKCFNCTYDKLVRGFKRCGQISYLNELNKHYL